MNADEHRWIKMIFLNRRWTQMNTDGLRWFFWTADERRWTQMD